MQDYVSHTQMSIEDKISYSLAMMENKVNRYFTDDEFSGLIAHFVVLQLSINAEIKSFGERYMT